MEEELGDGDYDADGCDGSGSGLFEEEEEDWLDDDDSGSGSGAGSWVAANGCRRGPAVAPRPGVCPFALWANCSCGAAPYSNHSNYGCVSI